MFLCVEVASLPGIVGRSLGMPDLHSGYGFSIGNVVNLLVCVACTFLVLIPPFFSPSLKAAFDMDDPMSIVSPGGVGRAMLSLLVILLPFFCLFLLMIECQKKVLTSTVECD